MCYDFIQDKSYLFVKSLLTFHEVRYPQSQSMEEETGHRFRRFISSFDQRIWDLCTTNSRKIEESMQEKICSISSTIRPLL